MHKFSPANRMTSISELKKFLKTHEISIEKAADSIIQCSLITDCDRCAFKEAADCFTLKDLMIQLLLKKYISTEKKNEKLNKQLKEIKNINKKLQIHVKEQAELLNEYLITKEKDEQRER